MISYKVYCILTEIVHKTADILIGFGIKLIPNLDERTSFNSLNTRKIWIHASSVGEVRGVFPLVTKILEEYSNSDLIFTTSSQTGKNEVIRLLPGVETCLAPLDTAKIVKKFIKIYSPKLLIINETEIWPAMLFEAKSAGIQSILVNGRISDRAIKKYLFFKLFFRLVLNSFTKIYVQSELDKSRFIKIGANPDVVEVFGLTKFDFPVTFGNKEFSLWWDKLSIGLSFNDNSFFIAIGSVREEEEEEVIIFINEFLRLTNESNISPIFFIAPRHPERFLEFSNLLSNLGFKILKRSDNEILSNANIIVLDRIGELLEVYSKADVCFVGGTFSNIGGHNVLEPAYFGKPIFSGENTQNIRYVSELLESGGGLIKVKDGKMLAEKILTLTKDLNTLVKMGEKSFSIYQGIKGATNKIYNSMKQLGLLNILAFYLFLFTSFILSGCSPTKGYSGPELPETELALVYYDECDSQVKKIRSSTGGHEFNTSGISLLPGKHAFDSFVEVPYKPYDCVPETTFDQYGYDSCLSRREEAISKNKKYIPDCYYSDYNKTIYWCMQNFRQFVCALNVDLSKGQKYNLCSTHNVGKVYSKISIIKSVNPVSQAECGFTNEEIRRQEFSSPQY